MSSYVDSYYVADRWIAVLDASRMDDPMLVTTKRRLEQQSKQVWVKRRKNNKGYTLFVYGGYTGVQ